MQIPGMIRKTGIVKAGLSRYLIDGFKSGIPPTETIEMKKKTIEINTRQKPIEYRSSVLKSKIGLSEILLSKNLGRIAAPIKKATNPIIIVIVKLKVKLFKDKSRKIAKTKITIKGEKIYLLIILFLLRKPKKFFEG